MPQIIPIKDLKNTSEISDMCHKTEEPIYVTKNGYGDMVIMSMEIYESTMRQIAMDCDTVIMSLGTSPNPLISSTTKGLETNRRKCIVATEDTGATSKDGVYAGGDAVTGAATVILAMGAGKAAAKGIDEYLSGKNN